MAVGVWHVRFRFGISSRGGPVFRGSAVCRIVFCKVWDLGLTDVGLGASALPRV